MKEGAPSGRSIRFRDPAVEADEHRTAVLELVETGDIDLACR